MSETDEIPLSYSTPSFPSLYWPFNTLPTEPKYLYTLTDIWKFTLYWTLITIPLAHILVALWAILMQFLSAGDRSRILRQTYVHKTSAKIGHHHHRARERRKAKSKSRAKTKKSATQEDEKAATSTLGFNSQETKGNKDKRGARHTDARSNQTHAQDEENYYTAGSASESDGNDRIESSTRTKANSNSNTKSKSTLESGLESDNSSSSTSSASTTTRHTRSKVMAKNRKLLGGSPFKSTIKWSGVILAVYMVLGAIEAFIAGSLVGVVLGAVYNAGNFRMSVWTPLFWGIINMLVLILASFRISGGM